MDMGNKTIVWYDRALKLWTAVYHDQEDYTVGNTGYGMSKIEAIKDLEYQNGFVPKLFAESESK